jgi:hypothetical protein
MENRYPPTRYSVSCLLVEIARLVIAKSKYLKVAASAMQSLLLAVKKEFQLSENEETLSSFYMNRISRAKLWINPMTEIEAWSREEIRSPFSVPIYPSDTQSFMHYLEWACTRYGEENLISRQDVLNGLESEDLWERCIRGPKIGEFPKMATSPKTIIDLNSLQDDVGDEKMNETVFI